jgi:SAM-dependent methyltransferase
MSKNGMDDKILIHKKPVELIPSKFLAKYAEEIASNSNGTIIDVPCGYGRNAAYIASLGVPVVCIDINDEALKFIKSSVSLKMARSNNTYQLITLKLDLINDPWPFRDESISAIINVHFFNKRAMGIFLKSLKIGGYLLIETIDGHGENYLELPKQGFIRGELADAFEIKYFKEKKVGPLHSNASTAKLVAIKRKSLII